MFYLKVTGNIQEKVRVPDRGKFEIKNDMVNVTHREMVDYLINGGVGRDGMKFELLDKINVPDFNTMKKPPPIVKIDGPKPKVSISVLMCNRLEYSMACVSSIITSKTNIEYEIILTDNGSTDNGVTKKYLKELDNDKIVKVFHKKNLGFIKGHEHALGIAKNEIFLMLNNDCVVCDNWLDKIVDGFKDSMVRAVGHQAAIMQSNATGIRTNGENFDYLEGSCLALPVNFVKVFGMFDPEYKFCYGEDFDLCMRLRIAGYKLKKVDINIKHDRNILTIQTIKNGKKLLDINREVWTRKWGSFIKNRDMKVYSKNGRQVYIIKRAGAIGDVLYVLSIAQHFKTLEPNCEIIAQTIVPQIISKSPFVDRVIPHNHKEFIAGTLIDLDNASEKRPEKLTVDCYAEEAGIQLKEKYPIIPFDFKFNEIVKKMYKEPYVVVHWGPAPGWDGRNYEESKAEEVVLGIKKMGYKVVEVGHRSNTKFADYPIIGQDWSLVVEIIRESDGFVGIDSVIMNLAQCMKIPGVALFGCVDPRAVLYPDSSIKPVFLEGSDCLFCYNDAEKNPPPVNFIRCSKGRDECVKKITPEMMLEKCGSVFDKKDIIDQDISITEKTAVVLGCARNGTSMASGMVHNFGIDMNPEDNPQKWNPKGSFEDKELGVLTMEMQKSDADLKELHKKLLELLKERNKKDVWGFKSALTHWHMDKIVPYLRNPYLIFIVRGIKENIFAKQHGWAISNKAKVKPKNSELEKLTIKDVENPLKDFDVLLKAYCDADYPKIMITYDQIQNKPIETAQKLADFLGVKKFSKENIEKFIIPGYSCWKKKVKK
jgi:ADP-heptose:LPS heptosyltransferase